jgi:hypothetical protein
MGELWGSSSQLHQRVNALLRELANPNLHDIPNNLPCRVELWDRSNQHSRWVIAASSSIAVGHASLDPLSPTSQASGSRSALAYWLFESTRRSEHRPAALEFFFTKAHRDDCA